MPLHWKHLPWINLRTIRSSKKSERTLTSYFCPTSLNKRMKGEKRTKSKGNEKNSPLTRLNDQFPGLFVAFSSENPSGINTTRTIRHTDDWSQSSSRLYTKGVASLFAWRGS